MNFGTQPARRPSTPASSTLERKPNFRNGERSAAASGSSPSGFQAPSPIAATPSSSLSARLCFKKPSAFDARHQLALVGELVVHLVFVPHFAPVDDHRERAALALDQIDLHTRKSLFEPGGQTGRPRKIVS